MTEIDFPFKVEYAKSGRASCKSCKNTISKDELRLATIVQSRSFDGRMTNWFHFACFFLKNKPKSTGDIDGFSNIKYDDQKRIEKKVGSGGGTAEIAMKKNVSAKAKKEAVLEYSVEYAKTGRSTCRSCDMLIGKDQIRISKMEYDTERARAYGPYPGWYHLECFLGKREELGWFLPAQDLPGYKSLGIEEQKMLKEKIPKMAPVKRPAEEEENAAPTPKKIKSEDESLLKKQSDKLFSLQKQLEREMTKRQLIEIFEFNNLFVPTGISRLVEWLADAIIFGVCAPCPQCNNKALRFKNNTYKCYGDFSEFTTCDYTTTDPKRSKLKVPKEFLEAFPFLKGSTGKRIIPQNAAKPTVTPKVEPRESSVEKVLSGCKIVVDDTVQKFAVVQAKIKSYGGSIIAKVNSKTLCVISTQEKVEEMSRNVELAKKLNIFVVSEDFLEKCAKKAVDFKPHSLADWGDEARVAKLLAEAQKSAQELSSKSGKSIYAKSGETKMKIKMNGLAAVDPDSGLDGIAKVYQRGKDVFSCVLGSADVSRGTNSYYKLQLLESKKAYFVFRAWGRIGTTIGGTKLEEHSTLQDALLDFKAVFLEKTGNDWESRKNFVKKPKFFDIIDMDYMQDESPVDKKEILATSSDSKLPLAVQELVCHIFDVNVMSQQMREFEIDLQKMPLGKISKEQISKAYKILTELQSLIDKKSSRLQFLDASNRFFTVIPHDFGMKAPPLLDNLDMIKEKVDMLDSLGEMEQTMKMLKQETPTASLPVDHHYTQLKADIKVLPRDGETFGILQKYVTTTHAETHSAYELEIMDIFTVAREGEAQRFKPFKRLHNRKLLWHGSRLSNFAGIISQGLRIAPPEAPVTGYMFGKGIYFADMVSKSANYCCTTSANPVGLLLLCEVALGDTHDLTKAENVTKLPNKTHSVRGVGKTQPSKEEKLDNAVVPMGPSQKTDIETTLLYNEYIVYDVAQVQIKYLMKVNFNHKI